MSEYVLSLSYGKDSLACLGAIEKLGWPLDRIIHAEVWATDTIPADLPPMVEFKAKADAIIFERWGIQVEHVCAMRKVKDQGAETNGVPSSSKQECLAPQYEKVTFEKLFYHVPKRKRGGGGADSRRDRSGDFRALGTTGATATSSGERFSNGTIQGFPGFVTWCNSGLKRAAMQGMARNYTGDVLQATQTGRQAFFDRPIAQGAKTNIVQYIGIAADETERIERHAQKPDVMLPLVELGWEESYCREWCEKNGLLSPIYTTATRGGCWFCHNQGVNQLRLLRKNYPELWALMLKWDKDSPATFHSDGHTVHDFDRRFALEDEGLLVPGARNFRWSMLEDDLNYRWF